MHQDSTPYLSYHKLHTFETCPKIIAYWKTHPREEGDRDARNAYVGSIVHTVAERYLKGELTRQELFSAAPPIAEEFEKSHRITWRGGNDRLNQRTHVQLHIANLEHLLKLYNISPDSTESEMTLRWESPKLILAGRIDMLNSWDDLKIIYDLKATDRPRTIDLTQMYFYFILAGLNGHEIDHGRFLCTKDGSTIRVDRSQAIEHELMETMIRVARRTVETDDLPMTPGHHCNWCDFRDICPGYSMARKRKEYLDDPNRPTGWSEW